MNPRRSVRLVLLASLALPGLAFAHPGHGPESGFALGFAHPFDGFDHVAVLLAAGLLARRLGVFGSVSFMGGLLSLILIGHSDWIAPGAEGWGFVAGFLVASATLIGAGMGASAVYRHLVTVRARRSASSAAGAESERRSTSSR